MKYLAAFLLAFAGFATAGWACGPDSNCNIGDRHYRIAMPQGHDGTTPVPAIVFAHGFRGSAKGVMGNGSMRRVASQLGAALIAPKSDGPGWELPNGPRSMDSDGAVEFAYFDAMMEDVASRFTVDTSRVLVTGFSAGGMMVWNLACSRSDRYAAFAPISGTFWLNPPASCSGPVANIIHIHGDSDRTVPLTGRVIGPTKQGEVQHSLDMYRGYGNFGDFSAARYDDLRCEEAANAQGDILKFCLFKGGHSFRTEFIRFAWDQFKSTGRL